MKSKEDSFVRLMRTVACTYCGAGPGEPCKSKTGNRTSYDHAPRFYLAKQALKERS